MPVHAADADEQFIVGEERADERLDRAIQEIEFALAHDDPDFVWRMRRPARAKSSNAATIVLFLVATVVLLAMGLATYSWYPSVAGALTFLAAFAVDRFESRPVRT